MVEGEADGGDECLKNHEKANLANQLLIPEQSDEGHYARDEELHHVHDEGITFGAELQGDLNGNEGKMDAVSIPDDQSVHIFAV